MSILINRCSRRAHLEEELVEAALLAGHRDAMRACDAEELVMESLELSKLFIHATGNVINHLYDDKIENIDGCYRGVTKAFELAISVIKNINTFAREVVENDYPIERYDELKAMIPRLERARVDFENKWPKINPAMIAASRENYRLEEYEFAGELLRATKDSGT